MVCHVLLLSNGAVPRLSRQGEVRLFSKIRNEKLRLPAFLRHYRSLGVDRFFIVDNDSTDGSTEYLLAGPDVHLFGLVPAFEKQGGALTGSALLREFGVGSWCVTVDVDELLSFPGSEQANLRQLTCYLDRQGYEALTCLLLDLYPSGSLSACRFSPEEDLLTAAPYFDIGPCLRTKPAQGRSTPLMGLSEASGDASFTQRRG